MSLLEDRDAVALALINRGQRRIGAPEFSSIDDLIVDRWLEEHRSIASAVIACLSLRGWLPPPGGG